jgi:hypothetical protein
MNIHKNARLTPLRREEMAQAMIEGGFPKPMRRERMVCLPRSWCVGSSAKSAEGSKCMADRSSRPTIMPGPD